MDEQNTGHEDADFDSEKEDSASRDKALPLANGKSKSTRLPVATHTGMLEIGDAKIPCFVLDDERRVLSGRAVTQAMGLTGRGPGVERFLMAKSLQPFISDKLKESLTSPIEFVVKTGLPQPQGYEATVLPELCHAVIDADAEKGLPRQQKKMAIQARILSRGFATIGITALVDEATGYQQLRDKVALQEILSRYITGELLEWARMFPDEFYKELFRLRGWQYHNMSMKRPILVGKLTVDLVYKRLAPGVYTKLKLVNPKNEKGRLRHTYTQWLTDEEGKPALDRHLHTLTALMRASSSWDGFMRLTNRSLPRYNENVALPGVDWSECNDDEPEDIQP